MKKRLAISLIILSLFSLVGCRKQAPAASSNTPQEKIKLTYYRLFDDADIFEPLIREYESQNKNVQIVYKKFTNPDQYLNLIINELAEGEGPDMFSMQNTWFTQHRKKLTPVPSSLISVEDFKNVFASVAADNLVLLDGSGRNQVYGLPMYIDTLALYYNQDQFEDAIPSRGKPASTWDQFQEDVFKLTKPDKSFERFEVAGAAMGRADNILRAIDVLYLLMIQFGTEFYDPRYTEATFANSQGATSTGLSTPGLEAIDFFTQFALPSSKYYTWNSTLSDAESEEQEVKTFARGKVSMIFGYSYLYEQIMNEIEELEKTDSKTISKNAVQVAPVPQLEDPEVSTDKRDAYASYFAETVSRTSKHPEEAWKFLSFLVSKENLEYYHEQTNRPTSRRDLIETQMEDPLYGVFAQQIGYAESLPMADDEAYDLIFAKAIGDILTTIDPQKALKAAQDKVNLLIPEGGLFPVTVLNEKGEENDDADDKK